MASFYLFSVHHIGHLLVYRFLQFLVNFSKFIGIMLHFCHVRYCRWFVGKNFMVNGTANKHYVGDLQHTT